MQKLSKLILCAGLSTIAMAGLVGCGNDGGNTDSASLPVSPEEQKAMPPLASGGTAEGSGTGSEGSTGNKVP